MGKTSNRKNMNLNQKEVTLSREPRGEVYTPKAIIQLMVSVLVDNAQKASKKGTSRSKMK